MTTAARPTWDTAKGGRGKGEGDLSALSKQYSSRDLPSHTKLKHSDDEDDTAELLAELQRIKKERAQEEAKKEREKKEEEEKIRMENIMTGNPLLNTQNNFKVKRRWDDDVVFKNCAKGEDGKKKEQHFINDTLRSEFHKKFMQKYVK
ncbi:hypothetical protein pdam_00001253 [Pocillopora damicornis]|uniref:Cwf15/Cwc15 cell cycle control protein n=1 Tax=Pocillopora damicornis TaxID=46731 RepID=A0A3M6TLE8_POCDA|nr:hypothetical protein pdam_00001253 [Pocillopora damicornis]